MTYDYAKGDHEGACFCQGSGFGDEGGLTRRQVLTHMVAAGSTLAGGGSKTLAGKPGKREQPPHRDCIIEASWVLAWQDGRLTLIRDGSVRVREDRIVEVKAGRITGIRARIRCKSGKRSGILHG
jgi:hypothetical protein